MLLSVNDLEAHIENNFGQEKGGTYFGIIETNYNYDTDGLTIRVIHYKDKENGRSYKLTFNEVVCCRITQESYIHEFAEEIWEGFSFFWINKNSRFKKDFNSWSSYDGFYSVGHYNNLKAYRIGGQNNFIDVLTTEEPLIELIG